MKPINMTMINHTTASESDAAKDLIKHIIKNRKRKEDDKLEQAAHSLFIMKNSASPRFAQNMGPDSVRGRKEKKSLEKPAPGNLSIPGREGEIRPERVYDRHIKGVPGQQHVSDTKNDTVQNPSPVMATGMKEADATPLKGVPGQQHVSDTKSDTVQNPSPLMTTGMKQADATPQQVSRNRGRADQSESKEIGAKPDSKSDPERSDKSMAGSAGVSQNNTTPLREKSETAPLHEMRTRETPPQDVQVSKDAQAEQLSAGKHDEVLKYHFKRWGTDHFVAIKENSGSDTLLQPSDPLVRDRLEQALREKSTADWQLEDENREHSHPQNTKDGEEDD